MRRSKNVPAQTCSVPGRCCGPPNWLRSVRLSRRPMERSGTRTKVRKGWGTGVAFVPFPRPAANSPVTQGGPRKDANVRRGRSVSRTRRDHTRLGQGQCFLVVASGKQLGFLLTVFFPTCPRTSKQSPPLFSGQKALSRRLSQLRRSSMYVHTSAVRAVASRLLLCLASAAGAFPPHGEPPAFLNIQQA